MRNFARNQQAYRRKQAGVSAGFSMVELLIAMALMGFLTLAITNMLIKGNSTSASLDARYRQASEVQNVILDMQRDLQQGVYISDNSHKYRLEYTTYNSSGTAVKKAYAICYAAAVASSSDTTCGVSSASNTTPYLKYSSDGGSTWGSPYRISSYSQFQLSGSPLFLYAQDANNCTLFTDTNANGVWQNGTDAAGSSSSCGSYSTSSPVLSKPSQASKVVLSGFQFNVNMGTTPIARSLPANIFMAAPQGVVVSGSAAVSPGVKDSPMLSSFVTNTANSLFGTAFDVRSAYWNPSHQRLIVVGHHSSGGNSIFQMERNGVRISPTYSTADTNVQLIGATMLDDDQTLVALDDSAKKVYWYSLGMTTSSLSPMQTLNLANPSLGTPALAGTSNLVNSPTGILYDPKYPGEIFIVGTDPADSAMKIFEIDTGTGSLATTLFATGKLALPAAFDASHPPGGFSQEPTTGDFLVVRNYVNATSPKTIDIYRITSAGASTSFSVDVETYMATSATGVTGNWGLSYSPQMNHLFLADSASAKIFEVYPTVLISPRS